MRKRGNLYSLDEWELDVLRVFNKQRNRTLKSVDKRGKATTRQLTIRFGIDKECHELWMEHCIITDGSGYCNTRQR